MFPTVLKSVVIVFKSNQGQLRAPNFKIFSVFYFSSQIPKQTDFFGYASDMVRNAWMMLQDLPLLFLVQSLSNIFIRIFRSVLQ